MTKLDTFNKITWGGQNISKVYHTNREIWSSVPGSSTLIAGDMNAGFYGEVPVSEFITGNELCSLAGITAGEPTRYASYDPWLKFSYLGETVFVSRAPIRARISWDHINSKGCVFGQKIVTIKGQRYKVTLLKGKTEGKQNDSKSKSGSINHNSMWNKLLGQVHVNAPDKWAYKANMESTLVNWGINYTHFDMITQNSYGDGAECWCQEYGESTSKRLVRGYDGVSHSGSLTPSWGEAISYGFRPALILEDEKTIIRNALNEARMNLIIKTGNGNEWTVGSQITGVRQDFQPLPATFLTSNGEVIDVTYISTNPAALTNKGGRVGPGNTILRAYFKHPEQPDLLPTITPSYAEFYVTVT